MLVQAINCNLQLNKPLIVSASLRIVTTDFEVIREWLYFPGNPFSLKQKPYSVDSGICVLNRFFGSTNHIDFKLNSVQAFQRRCGKVEVQKHGKAEKWRSGKRRI